MASAMTSQIKSFNGMRAAPSLKSARTARAAPRVARKSVETRADFIGSSNNLIMVASTTACLVAGRFGLAPTANKSASAGLKLSESPAGLKTNDPSGFTIVDVLALGSFGHALGAGIILGLYQL